MSVYLHNVSAGALFNCSFARFGTRTESQLAMLASDNRLRSTLRLEVKTIFAKENSFTGFHVFYYSLDHSQYQQIDTFVICYAMLNFSMFFKKPSLIYLIKSRFFEKSLGTFKPTCKGVLSVEFTNMYSNCPPNFSHPSFL